MRVVPVEGVAILLGVDRFMSEARAITNLIGNGAATLVVARSENAFDERSGECGGGAACPAPRRCNRVGTA